MAKIDMYRPYLSGKEIIILAELVKSSYESNPSSMELKVLYRKFKQFQFKIAEGLVIPNATRNENIEESLGLVKNPNAKPESDFRIRLNDLATRFSIDSNSLTEEEIEEGKRLELLEYQMEMGLFSK